MLDALNLDRVTVLANSAGGTSAIQMALRHPDRVKALVLVSSKNLLVLYILFGCDK